MKIESAENQGHYEDEWIECNFCGGEGLIEHDCGEDTCCCIDPELNVECDTCEGNGGWENGE